MSVIISSLDEPQLLIGEPLALDLTNTLIHAAQGEFDLLKEPAALATWLELQGDRVPQPDRTVSAADLAMVTDLRHHVAAAIEHARRGERPPQRSLQALTDAQRAAPEYWQLGIDDRGGVVAESHRLGSYAARLCAHLAATATDLLTGPGVDRLEQCAHPQCVAWFLPTHPRRRWCSTRCGNRARVARYYRRHKPN
jgi:predicted RNA-binding Zn ribbon-like protein